MAASSTDKVISIESRRRSLFGEIAGKPNTIDSYTELFDVNRLVIDSPAVRSDLRIIEESDDEVQQCIETRMDTLVGVDWRLEGGSEEVRDWLTEQVKRHYDAIVKTAWESKLYGYNVMERIWIKQDGMYVVERVPEKPFEWFVPKRDDTLWYRRHSSIILPRAISIDGIQVDTNFKFLLTKHKPTWRNPRGKALLAYLFWPWFFRKATWQFWMQFLERNGQPLLVGTGNDPAQIAAQLALAVQDAVIGVPKDTTVESISPNNRGQAFEVAEDKLVRRIQRLLLGQTLTSDTANKGSGAKALGEVHNEVRLDKTIGDLKLVGPTIQNYVNALQMLNFPSSRSVHLVYAIDRGLEAGRSNRDATLINSGNLEFTEQYYMREYGFKEGDIKVIFPSKIQQAQADQKKTNAENSDNKGSNSGNEDQSNNEKNAKATRDATHVQTIEVVQALSSMVTTAISSLPPTEVKVTMPEVHVAAPVINPQFDITATITPNTQTSTKRIISRQIADGVFEGIVTEELNSVP